MKKTLVLTHEYYPFKGGVARYCYNLFKFFDPSKYLVVTDNPEIKSKDNFINTKLKWPWLRPTWLPAYFKLKKIIKKNNIEQIFTPNILPLGTLAYFLKIPYIISLHGLDINLAISHKPKLTKKILENAKFIIANTKNTAEISKKFLDSKGPQIKVIYPSIDFDTTYDEIKLAAWRNKLAIGDEKIIMTLGRLNKRKGQDLLIQAIAKLKNDYKLKYFIIGRGQEKDYLQSLIEQYKLSDTVYIFDNIDDEDLIYFFKLADIFAMPHRQIGREDIEGFGMVFLEAAACRLPIIAGNSGGVRELFDSLDQALLLNSEDIGTLIKAIKFLLDNPDKANKLGEAAYKRSNQFFEPAKQSLVFKKILK